MPAENHVRGTNLEAPRPATEDERLAALHDLNLVGTPAEERFDRITRIAQRLFGVPIALISLVDTNRQWFKSCQGLSISETPRSMSFCAYALERRDPLIIPDATQDPRFADNPLVTGEMHIRFYAGQPLTGPSGHVFGTLCVLDTRPREMSTADVAALRDLSHWAEDELNAVELSRAYRIKEESETRLRAVMDNVVEGIVTFDVEHRIESINPAAEQMFGYSAAEVAGRDGAILFEPADWDMLSVLLSGEIKTNGRDQGVRRDAVGRTRNGATFPMETALSAVLLNGQRHSIVLVRDITERQQAEAALRSALVEREAQYRDADRARSETRAVLDSTAEAIAFVGPDRRFLTVNRQFTHFFGSDAGDITGRVFDDLRDHVTHVFADPDVFMEAVRRAFADPDHQRTTLITQIWPYRRELELFSTAVRGVDKENLGRLYVFRDVTHEREVDRMKSEFVSLVSHELRTPLTAIKGFVDLLLDGDVGEVTEDQREMLVIVRNNADRLVALINDLLDLSRIESGRITLQRAPQDIRQLIRDVAATLQPQIAEKGQILLVDVAPAFPSRGGMGTASPR